MGGCGSRTGGAVYGAVLGAIVALIPTLIGAVFITDLLRQRHPRPTSEERRPTVDGDMFSHRRAPGAPFATGRRARPGEPDRRRRVHPGQSADRGLDPARQVPVKGHDWPIHQSGRLIDRSTQAWVRATGTSVDLAVHPWLLGPPGGTGVVADEWLPIEAKRLGGVVAEGGGLVDRFDRLNGPGFDAAQLASPIVKFYERTAEWRLEAWSQWNPVAWPFGWMLSALFARRLQQLSLPLRPLDVAQGMDSRVLAVVAPDGSQLGSAWLRRLRSTGQTVYSGWYGIAQLSNSDRPSIRVMFPLPHGGVAVFLRPDVRDDGALVLTSPLGRFGDDGAYLIVSRAGTSSASVRRVPLAERFVVWVDDEGTLRADHDLNLWRVPVLRFHYRLDHRGTTAAR